MGLVSLGEGLNSVREEGLGCKPPSPGIAMSMLLSLCISLSSHFSLHLKSIHSGYWRVKLCHLAME